MQKLFVILAGAGVGIAATILCVPLGLHPGCFKAVAICNLSIGIAAALAGDAAAGYYRRRIKQDTFTRLEIERVMNAVSERYALNPYQNVLIALEMLRGMLDTRSYRENSNS